MKMNTFICGLMTAFLLATIPLPLAQVEAKIEYVEKDFTVMVLPDSDGEGFEPHILAGPSIDGDQWLYVDSPTGLGNTQGGNLWISKDHGETWAWYDKDTALGTSGDSYTAVTRDGAIYYTDLYLSSASVDSSLDGGETWIANPFASVYVLDDRQWLHVGPNSQGGENLYFSFNELLVGLVMVKAEYTGLTGVALDWKPCNNGLPISSNVGSRDNFAVCQDTGNIYHANYQSNGVFCYVSTNEGNSFTRYQVHDETVHARVQNTFIDMDVDTAGNVYMMWSSREHIMLGISTNQGQDWDVKEVTELDGCRVLPWIAAGDEGRIAMAWYDTNSTGNPNNLDEAWWDFVVAISINALDPDPTYEYVVVEPNAHHGSVRTSGLDGDEGPAPDRDLGDFIGIDIDEHGRAIAVFGIDKDDGPNARQVPCFFARQNEGPFLIEKLGPVANFTVKRDDLTVKANGYHSWDWNGRRIINYTWDWGDNSTSSGEDGNATHSYAAEGSYLITLTIQNEDGLYDTTSMMVKVEEGEGASYWPYYISGLVILVMVLGVAMVTRKKKPGDDIPMGIPVAEPVKEAEKVEEASEGEMEYGGEIKPEEGPPPGGG